MVEKPKILKSLFGPIHLRWKVITQYELYLNSRPDLLLQIQSLKGKILGCWCSPKACHCDILVSYANSKYVTNWFSNMLPLDKPYLYQGTLYKTSENFYQAMKLPKDKIDLRKEIASMSPYQAKRDIKKYTWRDSWNQEESLKVMEHILRVKFGPNTIWETKLKMSQDYELVEWNNWGDNFWGKDIVSKRGENNLGKILMKIREEKNV